MCIVNWLEALLTTVMVIILLYTAFHTRRSASAAERAATETMKATQASLIASFFDAYSSPEMLDAMLLLRDFKTCHGDEFADVFRRLRIDDYDSIREVDHARRRVTHHFLKIHTLMKLEYINSNEANEVATKGQVEFFLYVLEPLEEAVNHDYDRSAFESLGRLYDIQPRRLRMANPKPK